MADQHMTLDEFLAEQRRRLEAFERMWREEEEACGTGPVSLLPGDWDEQLQIFEDE